MSEFIINDYFYPEKDDEPIESRRSALLSKRKNIYEDRTDVIREYSPHICCSYSNNSRRGRQTSGQGLIGLSKFVRNFKILFIKGDDILLKNKNLKFNLDVEQDIISKQKNFQAQIAGE